MLLNMMKRNDAVYTFPIKKKKPLRQMISLYSTIFSVSGFCRSSFKNDLYTITDVWSIE